MKYSKYHINVISQHVLEPYLLDTLDIYLGQLIVINKILFHFKT